jgi:3-methylfumaryl-CoA hydratase
VPASVLKPAPQGDWRRQIMPTAVLLFRYSALTFNGHRIHYDRSYVTEVEGYPGLVVHGPLQATLLLDLIGEQAGAPLKSFSFRALHPVFDLMPFAIHGRNNGGSAALWVADHQGALCMEAEASW